MKSPIQYRKNIPFYCEKSKTEFASDKYESYHNTIRRHIALHLADGLWGSYPMHEVLQYGQYYYVEEDLQNIVEVGCGVGRWIAELATSFPKANCWGIDFSYQMLKCAHDFWVLGQDLEFDYSERGFESKLILEAKTLMNLNFGLARASDLPFATNSQDLVLSSFLIDRLTDPLAGLIEMKRVLKSAGKLICITPLNFADAEHWIQLYPPNKLRNEIIKLGFTILDWNEELQIEEPLDARGNIITWKCLAFVLSK